MEEVQRSLHNPRPGKSHVYTDSKIDARYADLNNIGSTILKPLPDIGPVCRDPDDDHITAAVMAVKADFIVTGDKDLLVLEQHRHIRILSAEAFLSEIG